MRRSTKRAVLNAGLFLSALFVILWLGRSSTSDKSFGWTRVRYQTTATHLPEARGFCPGLAEAVKPALVVARVAQDESRSWLTALQDHYHLCVYTADAPLDQSSRELQVPANRGHEAMAYLTFLIDNYDHIPEPGAVFIHGSRFAWHNDHPLYDNKELLFALNTSAALAPLGYHNLRCDWSASTCPPSVKPQGSWETASRAVIEPNNQRVVSDAALPNALRSLFGTNEADTSVLLGRHDVVRSQCCAQFVVSRKNIYQHTKEEYTALRQWLLDGMQPEKGSVNPQRPMPNRHAAPPDDRIAGRILSYVWHILFMPIDGEGLNLAQLNDMACPTAGECYCRLYGRCGLGTCSKGQCPGQYVLPQDFRLPPDWAVLHS